MKIYSPFISLVKNSRGIYSLDTSIGCHAGTINNPKGCYNDCYAAKSAKLYGYDFSKNILRSFKDETHRKEIVAKINNAKLDFIRIGTSGDPSENWGHCLSIIEQLKPINKMIVIITKHWTNLTVNQLKQIKGKNICINTSVSALDDESIIINSLQQYQMLKKYCKSLLRIVSANFNLQNNEGYRLNNIQEVLFKNTGVIDTVLRVNKNNPLFTEGIIKAERTKFLGSNTIASKRSKSTYFGKCETCFEQCGLNVKTDSELNNKGIIKQTKLFKT